MQVTILTPPPPVPPPPNGTSQCSNEKLINGLKIQILIDNNTNKYYRYYLVCFLLPKSFSVLNGWVGHHEAFDIY